MHLAGLPSDEAKATFLYVCEHELGCDPGRVPGGRHRGAFRLCSECAAKTGARIAEIGETEVIVYVEPNEP
jgi:hypothetical protein